MGAQVQFSCSFSQLWLSVLFTMNSKEFKPPSLSFGCLFLYFKDYPVSLKLQTHPRLGIQCRKKWAKIFPLRSPSFYCSLASSLANADKQHNTSYLLPHLSATSVFQYLDQRSIDYILDINECETNTHKCSSENVICLNTEGSFKCICKHGFSGDIYIIAKVINITQSGMPRPN